MTKEQSKKIGQVFLGTAMIALAVTLLITAHKGADTISIFLLGILTIVDLPFWIASLVFNACVLGIVAVLERKALGIGSFINGFGLGMLIGIFEPMLEQISISIPGYSIIAVIAAPILFGVGAGIYVSSNKGAAALEALTQVIYKYTKISVKYIRMGLDALMVIAGLLLGAPIGIGTFLCVIAIGPIFEATLKQLSNE